MRQTAEISVQMPPLHSGGQWDVKIHPARFKVLACGRRWGKTRLAVAETTEEAAANRGFAWWIAPSYKTAHVGWRIAVQLALQIPGCSIRKSDKMISYPGGGELWIKSGEDPDALRGEGLTLAVLDEAAYMKRAVWEGAIRAALADRLGRAYLISTPNGYNYFQQLYAMGVDPLITDYHSWQLPTSSNPYIDKAEIAAAKATLPQRVFEQEFLAQFVIDAGLVFRNLERAVQIGSELRKSAGMPTYPRRGFSYVLGCDWAQLRDFTVLYAAEVETRHVVEVDRFQQIDYITQRDRLKAMVHKYNAHYVLAEENSIGAPNIEALQNDGIPVAGFQTQQKSKDLLIRDLAAQLERGGIGLPDDPVTLNELQSFQMVRLPSGRWKYGAPEGMHDDCVMALALTNRAVDEGTLLADWV